jgi:hypothetical protein
MKPLDVTVADSTPPEPDVKQEALWALVYFTFYVAYLFLRLENEFLHWFSLVALPFAAIVLFQRKKSGLWSVKAALRTVGLRRGNLVPVLKNKVVLG